MSVGWPGICYSRRVSLIPTFDSCVAAAATAGPRGNRRKELVDRLMFHQISHPAGTMRRDDVDDRQQCHPSCRPSLLLLLLLCVLAVGEMMKQTSLPHTQRWIDPFRPFRPFFFFSYSVVTEFHHHPSTPGRKIFRFLFRRVYFKKISKNVDRRKMSLANQWAMIIGVICSTHTSQKKKKRPRH